MLSRHRTLACLSASLICISAQSQGLRPSLQRPTAEAIAQACLTLAESQGWRMAVAVNDETGQLLHFSRMHGAALISVPVSQLKANTSSALPISTRQFRAAVASNQGAELLSGITTVAGGMPIVNARGQALGSVGVSGGNEDQDELCAQAGLDAVKGLLP
jgi:glc operon protein GlcG